MQIINLFEKTLLEFGMSDVASLFDELKNIQHPMLVIDDDNATIRINFLLHGIHGYVRLKAKAGDGVDSMKSFRSKLFAASMAMTGGSRPKTWDEVKSSLSYGNIRPMALKILTNPINWKMIGAKYDNIVF